MQHTHHITAVAVRAAREAGAIALEGFRSRDLEIDLKTDMHDLVTPYDRACEHHIRDAILAAYPDSTIDGEEAGHRAGSGTLTWFIDPIDGTSNFARGIAMWAVSIGVASNGEMVSGVIFDPANDQLFWADDRGSFLVEGRAGGDKRLRSWGHTEPGEATVALNFPLPRDLVHQPELALEQFARVTKSFAQVRALGSTCIALAWIAAGWLDATISFETNTWDVAAGAFIIRQAGGIYHGYDSKGQRLPEARDYLGAHYYAAVPGGNFELLHEIMRTQSHRLLTE